MKDREIVFSDSDVENEIDGDKELTDIIDTLTEETIETLAEETVSKYYPFETNEEREETQCPNPRLESAHKLSKVLSSDVESGDGEDNYSLAKLRALNQLEGNITKRYSDVYGGIQIKKQRRIGRKNNTQKVC